jgi:hypothetical protein
VWFVTSVAYDDYDEVCEAYDAYDEAFDGV